MLDAEEALVRGNFQEAADLCDTALAAMQQGGWQEAVARLTKGRALRRLGSYPEAALEVNAAAGMFPSFKDAYMERAKLLLDQDLVDDALYALKQILKLDRKYVAGPSQQCPSNGS